MLWVSSGCRTFQQTDRQLGLVSPCADSRDEPPKLEAQVSHERPESRATLPSVANPPHGKVTQLTTTTADGNSTGPKEHEKLVFHKKLSLEFLLSLKKGHRVIAQRRGSTAPVAGRRGQLHGIGLPRHAGRCERLGQFMSLLQ